MKRRFILRYIALISACLPRTIGTKHSDATLPKSPEPKLRNRWVILYWMPYDNDLMRFGEPIIRMLAEGTRISDAIVVVQSDYLGDTKMRRRTLIKGTIQEIEVAGEDSSDSFALSEYLDWAYQTFDAEHWAVIVVGHGGKINEVSPDDSPSSQPSRTWMKVDKFARAVSNFNQLTDKRVELLFFQNCNKATLEVIYETRNFARYTLASQLTLGAPNYYYQGFLESLKEPSVRGREAAIAIMESERADMYHTLTLIDNSVVTQIPERLSPIVNKIINQTLTEFERLNLPTFSYFDEQQSDILAFLKSLLNDADREIDEFAYFLKTSVISNYKTGGELLGSSSFFNDYSEEFCGLSLYIPQDEATIYRYSSLAIYQHVDLVVLYKKYLSDKRFSSNNCPVTRIASHCRQILETHRL
jgi:Clostripain family